MKGIDNRAREAARDAARVEGVTLGAYLNKLILEEASSDSQGDLDVTDFRHRQANEAPSPRTAHDIASNALDRLTQRIETAEARSTLAITGIDQSVVGLLSRLENAEHAQEAFSIHVDGVLEDVRATHAQLAEKITEMESDDSGEINLAALKSLEDALGKLASHVYDENSLVSDETEAIKSRLESGLGELQNRFDNYDAEIDHKVALATDQLSSTVSNAELRAEGAARHLGERFTTLELDVADKLSHVETIGGVMNTVHAEITDAISGVRRDTTEEIGSINTALDAIKERLAQAETTTNAALQGLESTCESLNKRLSDVARYADAGAASELRREFEERFEGIADDLRGVVASARAEMAEEIEAATKLVDNRVIGELETAVSSMGNRLDANEELHGQTMDLVSETVNRVVESVDERLTANEQQQGQAMEQLGDQVSRISDGLDKRLNMVEEEQSKQSEMREDMQKLSASINERISNFESLDTGALDAVSDKVEQLADKLDERVLASEQRSAEAIEQVGEQVASVAARIDQRQEDAFRMFSEKLEDTQKRQASRLSDALANVSDRLERMQEQQVSTISPVQKAIASLAQRIESIEDFATPPYAERAKAPDLPELIEPQKIQTAIDVPDDGALFETDIAAASDNLASEIDAFSSESDLAPEASEDELFEAGFEGWDIADAALEAEPQAGLVETKDELTFASSAIEPATAESIDMPDYLADLADPETSWADSASEARDGDIFDSETDYSELSAASDTVFDANIDEFEETAASVSTEEEPEIETYLSRARAAAKAAAEADENSKKSRWGGNRSKQKSQAAPATAAESSGDTDKESLGSVPKIAAVSALAIATAGTAGYLYVRGKQAAPSLSVNQATLSAASRAPLTLKPLETASVTEKLDDAANADAEETSVEGASTDRLSLFAARIESAPDLSSDINTATPAEAGDLQGGDIFKDLPAIPSLFTAEAAAADGDPIAMLQIGLSKLAAGETADGAKLIQASASEGAAAAQYRLAKLHEQGLGVARDIQESRAWTERAANGGNVKAMHDLAVFMTEGEGGSQSYTSAAEWYRKAAEYGVVDSQFNLALFYQDGLGVSPSLTEALFWFEVAARQGDRDAEASAAALRERVSEIAASQVADRASSWTESELDAVANGDLSSVSWEAAPTPIQVKAIQTYLDALGYDTGTPDGAFGPRTEAAIRQFEVTNGLQSTGQISERLIVELNQISGKDRS